MTLNFSQYDKIVSQADANEQERGTYFFSIVNELFIMFPVRTAIYFPFQLFYSEPFVDNSIWFGGASDRAGGGSALRASISHKVLMLDLRPYFIENFQFRGRSIPVDDRAMPEE